LTIEFTRTHQELTLTAGATYVFRPPSGTCLHWIRVEGTENILKTLNTVISRDPTETTRGPKAAQPCSYIYPIYSVVKYRLRPNVSAFASTLQQLRALGRAGTYSLRYKLKDQFPALDDSSGGDSTSSWFSRLAGRPDSASETL